MWRVDEKGECFCFFRGDLLHWDKKQPVLLNTALIRLPLIPLSHFANQTKSLSSLSPAGVPWSQAHTAEGFDLTDGLM